MKTSFIRWAMTAPGVCNCTESRLRELMEDPSTTVGIAWRAWKASWRTRGDLPQTPSGPPHTLSRAETHR